MSVLVLRDIDYKYQNSKTYIFKRLSLQFDCQNIYAVQGTNGVGKTTLLNIIAGLYLPENGLLTYNNSPINPEDYKKITAYIPYEPIVYSFLNAMDHISLVGELWEIKGQEFTAYKHRVLGFLQVLGLHEWSGEATTYSQGMKYKLYLALMLARNPEILILDEPLTSLDQESQGVAQNLIKKMIGGTIVLFSSHQKEISKQLATQVLDLDLIKKEEIT